MLRTAFSISLLTTPHSHPSEHACPGATSHMMPLLTSVRNCEIGTDDLALLYCIVPIIDTIPGAGSVVEN